MSKAINVILHVILKTGFLKFFLKLTDKILGIPENSSQQSPKGNCRVKKELKNLLPSKFC
jgi:hypothetical protein